MLSLALLLTSAAALRWLDIPRTTLVAVSPILVAVAGLGSWASGVVA